MGTQFPLQTLESYFEFSEWSLNGHSRFEGAEDGLKSTLVVVNLPNTSTDISVTYHYFTNMKIDETTKLTAIEFILGSGAGTLDFAVEGDEEYYTWSGEEDSEWTIEDTDRVENDEEDRFILHPEDNFFTCIVDVTDEGKDTVNCWCE